MTISELQQMHMLQRNQAANERNRFQNVNNIIHEEVSTANEESVDQSMINANLNQQNHTKIEEFVQTQGTLKQTDLQPIKQNTFQNKKQNKTRAEDRRQTSKQYDEYDQLPQNLKNKYNKLKNSLISSTGEGLKITNRLKEETIYSYVDAEDESYEDEEEFEEINDLARDAQTVNPQNKSHKDQNAMNTLRQSDFMSNRSHYNQQSHYGRSSIRKLRQSQHGQVALLSYIKANEIKQSLKKTKRSLLSTKLKLRKEQYKNQEREDLLKKLQSEIEELNTRQKLTEEKIQSKDNMISILQRINSQNPSSASHSLIQVNSQNDNRSSSSKMGAQKDLSIIINHSKQNQNSFTQQRDISPQLRTNTSSMQNNCDISSSSNYVSQNAKQARGQTPDMSVNHGGLDASSKSLLEINDRLTKQIEDNLALFEDLNQELTLKDRVIAESQAKLREKQQEIDLLSQKISQMSSSMQKLMDLSQQSNQNKDKQESQMQSQKHIDKIQEQTAQFQKRIEKIDKAFSNVKYITNLYGGENSTNSQTYSRFQKRASVNNEQLYGNSALNCIPLSSPRTSLGGTNMLPISQSNNSSRIQDEEFSIGQIRNKQSIDADYIPVSQRQNVEQFGTLCSDDQTNKENCFMRNQVTNQQQKEDSLLNSKTLKSLYNDLKDSVMENNYATKDFEHNTFKQTLYNGTNVFNQHHKNYSDEDSTMLKYSQDVTKSLINTMNLRAQ